MFNLGMYINVPENNLKLSKFNKLFEPIMNINTTINGSGRLCNSIFRNIVSSIIAEKNNLCFTYNYKKEHDRLGIELFDKGTIKFQENTITLSDDDVEKYVEHEPLSFNILTFDHYYQTQYTAKLLRNYFKKHQEIIMSKNIFNKRYNDNNDIYVHVRLGDCVYLNHIAPYKYYDDAISELKSKMDASGIAYNLYVSSDTIDHKICKILIEKHKLMPIHYDPVETIMFGSTCKNVVLSLGSYSWVIGVLAYFSDIYYPDPNSLKKWHGDIFIFDDWNKRNVII
jgi:hypothetical protein